MNFQIYQAYYMEEHTARLDTDLIPYNNIGNNSPLLEYAIWKNLYKKHHSDDSHWGVLSWRYKEKIPLPGKLFKGWINSNPGYDVYHVNPYLGIIQFPNLWIQGELSGHVGIIRYINRLLVKLGYNFNIVTLEYTADEYSTCHYFVGNDKFWTRYLEFLDHIIKVSKQDFILNDYMFNQLSSYRNGKNGANNKPLINFPFIVERLFTLFCIFKPDIKVKQYPYESFVYNQTGYEDLLNFYYEKKIQEPKILSERKSLLKIL